MGASREPQITPIYRALERANAASFPLIPPSSQPNRYFPMVLYPERDLGGFMNHKSDRFFLREVLTIWVLVGGGLVGCKENVIEKPKTRTLRVSTRIQPWNLQNIQTPGGVFNFQSVMDAQLRDLLNSTDRYLVEAPSEGSVEGGLLVNMEVTGNDPDRQGRRFWQTHGEAEMGALSLGRDPWESQWPSCLRKPHQVEIGGQVLSFAMTFQGGLRLGYDPVGGVLLPGPGVGVDLQIQSASMDVRLRWVDPATRWILATGQATPQETELRLRGLIPFGMLLAQPELYHRTPLAQVTEQGITLAINRGQATLSERVPQEALWESQVLPSELGQSGQALVSAGRLHGVRVGDRFWVHSQRTIWTGAPCASTIVRREVSSEPIAQLQVEAGHGLLGQQFSWMRVIRGAVTPGAVVRIDQLVVP